jgi:LysM repeat protein
MQVQAGDTLWSIARAHPIAGLSTEQTAEAIARDNRLTVGALTAGQALLVPASAERGQALAKR